MSPQAHAIFTLKVTSSPSSRVSLGGTVTYSISVSNTVLVNAVRVSSQFDNADIIGANNVFSPGRVTTNQGNVVYTVDLLPNNTEATFDLQLRPTQAGGFTNLFRVETTSGSDPSVTTNVVVTVGAAEADLGMTISGLPPRLLIGDTFSYIVALTNAGPGAASGVNIQSTLPAGLTFLSVTPTTPSSFINQNLIISPGGLSNATASKFIITAQANTNGPLVFSTSVSATQNSDPTAGNNTVSSSITVLPLLTGQIAISSVTPMQFNRQNALMEQLVVITNLTTNVFSSVRVVATNLTSPNQLYNASGTNGGRPYVVIPGSLGPTNSASVLVQFFIPSRDPIDVGFQAVEAPLVSPLAVTTGTIIPFTKFTHLRSGFDRAIYSSVYLEFDTTVGRTYTLVYTPTVPASSTNWIAAQPPFVANSAHGQFFESAPQFTGDGDRFYQVIEQQ